MSRYRSYGPRDDQEVEDQDLFFRGFRSRMQPASLPPGIASYLGNMRCNRGTAAVRPGSKAVSTDIALDTPPLVLDVMLGADIAVTSITRVGTTATVTTATPHGFSNGQTIAIEHANQGAYNGDFIITVTGASTFTYTVAGAPATPATGAITCNAGPLLLEDYSESVRCAIEYADDSNGEGIVLALTNRAYVYLPGLASVLLTYPGGETVQDTDDASMLAFEGQVYLFRGLPTAAALTVSSITRAATTATVTTATPHGLSTGQWVNIVGTDQNEYRGIAQITSTGASTFTYQVAGAPATPATGAAITATPCKPALQWDRNLTHNFVTVPVGPNPTGGTIIRMPPTSWGVYFTRRLMLAYSRDEEILSDFDDMTSYDTGFEELRQVPAAQDHLVGAQPYQDLKVLILWRYSVHLLQLDATAAAPVNVTEITRSVGCAARRTITLCGDQILWLSDQGVARLMIGLELNLTMPQLPLSDGIQDIFDEEVNWAAIAGACAKYWNNRYYLAVPIGTSTQNNLVLVYNFLNQEWESADTYPGDFDVQSFCVLNYNGQKRLHAVTTFGFVVLLEEDDQDEFGTPGNVAAYPIIGTLVTRDYLCGTKSIKRFTGTQIELVANTMADALAVSFTTRNPDLVTPLAGFTADKMTDVSYRQRLRQRGVAGSVAITTSAGRPEFKSVTIGGFTSDRAPITRE